PPVPRMADGADARGIDHATDAGALAGLEYRARTVHIVAVDLARVLRPQPIVRRNMEDETAAGQSGSEGLWIEDVSAKDLHRAAGQRLQAARGPREDADAVAVGDEQPRHVGSHEAGGPGDQHVHVMRTRGKAYSSSRRRGASARAPFLRLLSWRADTIDVQRGEHDGEADRHPDGRWRRAGAELRDQVGGVPQRGARLHGGGAPARLGSPDPRRPSGS